VVSTQSPKALAPELLELSNVAIMHQFSSIDWFKHLSSRLPLSPQAFKKIMSLRRGEALIYARRHSIVRGCDLPNDDGNDNSEGDCEQDYVSANSSDPVTHKTENTNKINKKQPYGENIFPVLIRKRITADLGASVTN
jgi:hypothetical protein